MAMAWMCIFLVDSKEEEAVYIKRERERNEKNRRK
jgi:hypothetical protein